MIKKDIENIWLGPRQRSFEFEKTMDSKKSSVCKMCYMNIHPSAKKCPYCQHWQNKWLRVTTNPLFTLIPIMVISILLFWLVAKMFQATFFEGEPFSRYADMVSITDPKMVFGNRDSDGRSPTVAIIGKIENKSNISWKDLKLEVRFFDNDGKLIDTTQKEKCYFMAPKLDEITFKISSDREFSQEKYARFKIRIISAKDERKLF